MPRQPLIPPPTKSHAITPSHRSIHPPPNPNPRSSIIRQHRRAAEYCPSQSGCTTGHSVLREAGPSWYYTTLNHAERIKTASPSSYTSDGRTKYRSETVLVGRAKSPWPQIPVTKQQLARQEKRTEVLGWDRLRSAHKGYLHASADVVGEASD